MQPEHGHFEFAGFFRRMFAFALDTAIISALSTALLFVLFGAEALAELQQMDQFMQGDWRYIVIENGLPALWTISFWLVWMATPGKLLFDCEIVDAKSRRRARPWQLVVRYLAYIASAIPAGLGFLWVLWDKKKQGFHDKLAGTLVIMHDSSREPLEALR